MTFEIRNETSSRHDALAVRLTAIAEKTLPLVEDITALPLPSLVTVRLVSLRAWQKEHWRHGRRRARSEATDLRVSFPEIKAAALARKTERARFREAWFMYGARTIDLRKGHGHEIVLMPEALREGGRLHDDRFLHRMVAHEATHLAQYKAAGADLWTNLLTFFPQARGIADRDYATLVEGHAYWADAKIIDKLLGKPETPDHNISPHASPRYRALRNNPAYQPRTDAMHTVSTVIDALGTDRFNTVWSDLGLVPTHDEVLSPADWRARLHQGPA
ncbi:hypothetical protein [Streptomyces acidiscabies]|uniref:DUF2268 domain-containing protein n=1 Tax=Streptomyces acidiscabies TaxID=42234 RepID=A0ABU4MCK2_9ACTN|nr:hypothetical protein [Streptomyces acidiscabies]MDX3024959.1 hypothetical protein [Streptomyces acidiscabies]